jgi:uncharacterized protein
MSDDAFSLRVDASQTTGATMRERRFQAPTLWLVDRLRLSLAEAMQWTVSQTDVASLWAAVRQQAEDMLLVCWRDGELVGATAEQAFFVRCDRTTMTQTDIDNGRLVIVVGVATVRPAEFTTFTITRQVRQPGDSPPHRLFLAAPRPVRPH